VLFSLPRLARHSTLASFSRQGESPISAHSVFAIRNGAFGQAGVLYLYFHKYGSLRFLEICVSVRRSHVLRCLECLDWFVDIFLIWFSP